MILRNLTDVEMSDGDELLSSLFMIPTTNKEIKGRKKRGGGKRLLPIQLSHITFSIPPLPSPNIKHLLALSPPIQIHLQDLKRAIHIRIPQSTYMRRDDAIGRAPERVVFRQGFRVRDVERGAA